MLIISLSLQKLRGIACDCTSSTQQRIHLRLSRFVSLQSVKYGSDRVENNRQLQGTKSIYRRKEDHLSMVIWIVSDRSQT